MSRTQILVSLVAIPLLVLLVACGGDKKDSSSSNDGGSSNSSNSSNSSPGGGSSTGSVSSNDGAFSIENCKQFALAAAAAASSAPTSGGKLDKKVFEDMVKAAPSEIRSDMQVFADVMIAYLGDLEKLGVNLSDPSSFSRLDATKLQQLQTTMAKFDDKKFTDASERIEKFYASKCS